MKAKFACAALLAAAGAATAPTAAQAQTGLRIDVNAGWDKLSSQQRTDVGTSGATTRTKDEGVVYGVELGYDLSISKLTLGVYGGVQGSTIKECPEVFTEVEACAKVGRNLTLGVRAGYHVTDRVMLYAKGGYSNGQVKLDYIDHVAPANSFTDSQEMDGIHFGGGVQVDILSNLYAKVEYVRTDYEDYSLKQGSATITGGIDRDNVIFGVGFRF